MGRDEVELGSVRKGQINDVSRVSTRNATDLIVPTLHQMPNAAGAIKTLSPWSGRRKAKVLWDNWYINLLQRFRRL